MIVRLHSAMGRRARGERGFTLIELLVVVVILGILAAIAIPVFLGQREKAWVAQATSSLRNASTAAESFAIGNNGSCTGLDGPALATNGYFPTGNVALEVLTPTVAGYVLTATLPNLPSGTDTYTFTRSTGAITGPA